MLTNGIYSVKVIDEDKNPIEGVLVEFIETGETNETEHNGRTWSAASKNNAEGTQINIYASNVGYNDVLNIFVPKTFDVEDYTEIYLNKADKVENNPVTITGVKPGKTTITTKYDGKESSVKFTVKDKNNSKKKIVIGLVAFGVVAIITILAIILW